MINEKNFVSANEEDIEPSYVDAVVGNHDKADSAHKGLFSAINKKIDETEAFYKDAKDFVGDTADKVSSAERAAEDSNMHANRAAAAAGASEAARLGAEKARDDAERFSKRGPYVGDNGNWFLWDDSVSSYVDTGMSSKGDKGEPGYSPVKGEDYYTEVEKKELVAEVRSESIAKEDLCFEIVLDEDFVGNKTYDEIVEAHNAGKEIVFIRDNSDTEYTERSVMKLCEYMVSPDYICFEVFNGSSSTNIFCYSDNEWSKSGVGFATISYVDELVDEKADRVQEFAKTYTDRKIENRENVANKTTSIDGTDDTKYPSVGAVYNFVTNETNALQEQITTNKNNLNSAQEQIGNLISGMKVESDHRIVLDGKINANAEDITSLVDANAILSEQVQSIPRNLKYDMGFEVGNLQSSGNTSTLADGIVTKSVEPLVYDFDVWVKWDTSLYYFYNGIYNDDGTFSRIMLDGGIRLIPAGTKFRLWIRYKDSTVVLDDINDDIFYNLEVSSQKGAVDKSSLMSAGVLSTDSLDYVKEIYLEGAEGKNIAVYQVLKNYYLNSGKYLTRFSLSLAEDGKYYTPIAKYELITDEPIESFDVNTPIELTEVDGSGISGYAIVDFNTLEDGISYLAHTSVNMTKARNLALNPTIKALRDKEALNEIKASIPHDLKYDMNFTIGGISSSGEVTNYTTGVVTKTDEPLVYDFDIVVKFNPEICNFAYRIYQDNGKSYIMQSTTGIVRLLAGTKFRLLFKKTDPTLKFDSIYDDGIFDSLEISREESVASLNKDVEHLVMQASKSRSSKFGDTLVPLEFVHFTDLHAQKSEWKRIVEYIDEYQTYIKFALHTGDYSGTSVDNAVDLYALAKPKNRIIYNMVGNHDTYKAYASGESPESATAEEVYNTVFSDTSGWDVVFGEGENVTYYYKDFAESGIRLIVLDDQQWSDTQATWLASVLDGAKENGLAVITASHMLTANLTERPASTFVPVDKTPNVYGGSNLFEGIIVNFKDNGGTHICHLCGHNHFDDIGYTALGVLNIQAECATAASDARLESRRVAGTKSFDCFNVVAVDVNTKRLKIIRIGCNSNASLQDKTVLCYDYENRKIISGIDTSKVVASMADILDELHIHAENLISGGAE